jgi:Major Facilitator Superfamily
VWGLGCILGPVVGGAFADSGATWRWAFYINLIIAGVTAPIYFLYVPSFQPRPNTKWTDKLLHLDWTGIVLNAASYVLFIVILTFGGTEWAWNSGRIIAMWVVLGVIIIAFVLQQRYSFLTSPERRIFPVQFLKRRTFILSYFGTAAAATGLFTAVYYIPLFFQFVRSDTAIEAAVRLLPCVLVTVTVVMINGILMPILGYYMPWYVFSGVFLTIGGALMYTVTPETSTSALYGYSVLIALGAGSTLQAAYSITGSKVEPHDIAAAVGFINVGQLGSITLALGISSAVFQNVAFNKLQVALAGYNYSPADLRAAIAGTKSVIFMTADPAVQKLAVAAIVEAMDKVYALVIAAGALALVSSVFMKREKLFMNVTAG